MFWASGLPGMGSRFIDFRSYRSDGKDHPEADGTSFTFLGFCHVWGKSRKGKNVVRLVTAKQRYNRALAAVTEWCRKKWLSRRGSRFQWSRFKDLLRRHPLPAARIVHRYTAVSESLP